MLAPSPARGFVPGLNPTEKKRFRATHRLLNPVLVGMLGSHKRASAILYMCRIYAHRGREFAGYQTVADAVGCSHSTVKRAVNDLKRYHLVEAYRRRKERNFYSTNEIDFHALLVWLWSKLGHASTATAYRLLSVASWTNRVIIRGIFFHEEVTIDVPIPFPKRPRLINSWTHYEHRRH